LATAYRVCLWSRVASRVLLTLKRFPIASADDIYAAASELPWQTHMRASDTLLVDCAGRSRAINHTHFAVQRVKDAVVDLFRDRGEERPSVAREAPDLRINLHLHGEDAALAIDLSGDSLHRRGYRLEGGAAPLKENLAAALLMRAGWPQTFADGGALVDPFCGSGTFVIEAALMAAGIAPGMLREQFGFETWLGHDAGSWTALKAEAQAARDMAESGGARLFGSDADGGAIVRAQANAKRAGVGAWVQFEKRAVGALQPPADSGLVICNPPYGERLQLAELKPLYAELGATLAERFSDWRAAMITSDEELGFATGLRARKRNRVYNGPLECTFLQFDLQQQAERMRVKQAKLSAEGEGFANRLKKNAKHLQRWAKRENISCYRVYDADLHEFALAVDCYDDWVHVSEYEAPDTIDAAAAERRRRAALAVIPDVLGVSPDNLFFKTRRQQRGDAQYNAQAEQGKWREVSEGGLRFAVNPTDYLDTGLFLDHRQTRALVRELASGKRCLNLFAYTGSVSVYAAAGGAVETVTVDLSNTYLDWAQHNLDLNGFNTATNRLVRADCREWVAGKPTQQFDLIFIDPPTFSNSKRMEGTWDIQRDHGQLLADAWQWLAPGGTLIFSTNRRKFKLDETAVSEACQGAELREITQQTVPPDFQRGRPPHRCWRMDRAG
jgi:23S rRNA (guanine2445-N2)-methyltransferase / 23S rRNA (guanine2069-N7)-methyltransferase